jgi:osmotically-inducible protein OsmY
MHASLRLPPTPEEGIMRIRTIAIAGLAGAAAAYLFDPVAGNARRNRIRDQIRGFTRRLAMPERTPPLPVNMVSTPTMEAVTDTTEVPTKAADTTEVSTKAADTTEVPTKAADTTQVPTKAEVVATPEVPTKGEVADDPKSEDVASAPQERPSNVRDMPRERMKGYLADIREDRPMDDATIASLVRTRVLGRPDLDTGSLDVEVVQGVAFLRGDLKDKRQIDEVVDLTGAVPGVQEVQNLIHLPESPTGSRETATPLGDAWNG